MARIAESGVGQNAEKTNQSWVQNKLPLVESGQAEHLEAVDAEDASRVVAAVSATVGRLTHPEELAAGGRRIVQLTDLERSSITSATM